MTFRYQTTPLSFHPESFVLISRIYLARVKFEECCIYQISVEYPYIFVLVYLRRAYMNLCDTELRMWKWYSYFHALDL